MRINRDKLNCVNKKTTIDITTSNNPGLYFLFNEEYKLIYIGESKCPLSRILDHYSRSYEGSKTKKGIGPVFTYFRIVLLSIDEIRIRQHYEKRFIKKYKPKLNANSTTAPYTLTSKQLKAHVLLHEKFFNNISWYRYINDEVLKKMDAGLKHKKILRRASYLKTGR
jgi:excinuclease UvrABC nuclease subunit